MKPNINIESLVEKFNHGNISSEELATLVSYLKENEPGSELLNLYQKTWDSALLELNNENLSDSYSSILKKIEVNQSSSISQTYKFAKSFLKYAAVFAFAFSISWLINNQLNKQSDSIAFQNIEVPYGSKTKVQLPDGSYVTLNSGSKLRYGNSFGNNSRNVFLEGEAYFDVKKDAIPFYVNVSGIKVKVLGTSFNIKAYPEEKTIETTLVTGKIEIFKTGNSPEKTPLATLLPKQKAVYQKAENEIEMQEEKPETDAFAAAPVIMKPIKIEQSVKTELTTAWKDNEFVFDNERFEDIIKKVERW